MTRCNTILTESSSWYYIDGNVFASPTHLVLAEKGSQTHSGCVLVSGLGETRHVLCWPTTQLDSESAKTSRRMSVTDNAGSYQNTKAP